MGFPGPQGRPAWGAGVRDRGYGTGVWHKGCGSGGVGQGYGTGVWHKGCGSGGKGQGVRDTGCGVRDKGCGSGGKGQGVRDTGCGSGGVEYRDTIQECGAGGGVGGEVQGVWNRGIRDRSHE